MKHRKRFLTILLAVFLMISFSMTALAHGHGGGHHGRCRRQEVCVRQEEQMPCGHEHREDCYRLTAHCLHVHTEECCFSQESCGPCQDGGFCGHVCSLENGCLTRPLVCGY